MIDARKIPIKDQRQLQIPSVQVRKSVHLGQHLINRVIDISKKMGFANPSEFIRYAIRKELDIQSDLYYTPQILPSSDPRYDEPGSDD